MPTEYSNHSEEFDYQYKVYYELMARRVNEILLVSSPYDAFIMEEDGRIAERIIHEYRGLNLTRPPRINWASNTREAFRALKRQKFDVVITMPRLDDMNPYAFGKRIKGMQPGLPVFLLAHNTSHILSNPKYADRSAIDMTFVWYGNTDLLLALIKNVEDRMNVDYDTRRAKVRVIIMVEDSPYYASVFLPLLYKEIVGQTRAVIEESMNEEHRILKMRARPKILLVENFEEAENLYLRYKPYILSVFSDVRFPKDGKEYAAAGFELLQAIKNDSPDVPLLMLSSEEHNRRRAEEVPAVFLNKNAPGLHQDIRDFLKEHLGFGDFVFRMKNGTEVGRASDLRSMERALQSVPDEALLYHAGRNDFSSWLFARSEIELASRLRPVSTSDFESVEAARTYLVESIRERRKWRHKGVVTDFSSKAFDPDAEFVRIGKGSLGGKARGLAFVISLLKETFSLVGLQKKFPMVNIDVPKTLVISTDGFDSFVNSNDLTNMISEEMTDDAITQLFLGAKFPYWLRDDLKQYLTHIDYPLAVRSSSLLEDAQYQSCAGIYHTIMIPNNDPKLETRVQQLEWAIRLVYASTFMETPRTFTKNIAHRTEDEKMAIVIQKLTGTRVKNYFYPAVSGVGQSYNYYPIAHLKPEDGIAHVALGLGKTVVDGGTALRFSPRHPEFMPQFSRVEDILKNAQRYFYALNMDGFPDPWALLQDGTLVRREVDDAMDEFSVRALSSSYNPEDQRIRDAFDPRGYPVLTFAGILKHGTLPLTQIISEILEMGRRGMGCPVEIEFAVNLPQNNRDKPEFHLLQIRPMAFSDQEGEIEISDTEISRSFCFSDNALGNGRRNDIQDIVFVKPDAFDPAKTEIIAREIDHINKKMEKQKKKYLLIGPGRWGTADRWLGIPVTWKNISSVGTIIETSLKNLKADPSQGSHFFNNITSLGIGYITVADNGVDYLDWNWLEGLPAVESHETRFLRHAKPKAPLIIVIDGKTSRAVILQ